MGVRHLGCIQLVLILSAVYFMFAYGEKYTTEATMFALTAIVLSAIDQVRKDIRERPHQS
jgi:hypothetical protein